MPTPTEPATFDFGPVIHTYSRAEAIEDGVLVDLSALCPEECKLYKHNVCCTRAVWEIIDTAVNNKKECNDLKGVVWDVLVMSRNGIVAQPDPTTVLFQVVITGAGPRKVHKFKMVCGPGDTPEPVLTILLPEED